MSSMTEQHALRLAQVMVAACSKACEIARCCRKDNQTFERTMINKKPDRKVGNDVRVDMVTLADVLIQVSIIHDIELEIPQLQSFVKGEETGVFESRNDGSSVQVALQESEAATTAMISLLLDDDDSGIPSLLASILHRPLDLSVLNTTTITTEMDMDDVGIWVDPIDASSAYVVGKAKGTTGKIIDDESGRLPTCTVLIGAFKRSTGKPICGVVGQPFAEYIDRDTSSWQSRLFWGVVGTGTTTTGSFGVIPPEVIPPAQLCSGNKIGLTVISKSEPHVDVIRKCSDVKTVSGCGYKLLCVIRGVANSYAVTTSSTYPWDTCGPHAILLSMGGSVTNPSTAKPIQYSVNNPAAHHGVLACRDSITFETLKHALANIASK
eukprot:m.29833 g.29833  ORF g.29833 m.29833 type:complete len:380 (-) comp16166_c0_seq1:53-1192(-)